MTESPLLTQSLNGRPHLAYYDEGVSFVWSGSLTEPIEVCPGGYGEPVKARINLLADLGLVAHMQTARTAKDVVRAFGDICEAWLTKDWLGYGEADPVEVGDLRDEAAAEANTDGRW